MLTEFSRAELLLGASAIEKLNNAKVLVFGIGGVGGYVVEALARTGVGHFLLVDSDTVSLTNINRQIIATHDTIGMSKTLVMKNRILSINPKAEVEIRDCFFLPENADTFDFSKYDYIVDAVDTVAAKISIIEKAKNENVRIISSMGAGNKLRPDLFMVSDINQTSVDPLARVMRYELRKRGINHVKVVYSKEKPIEASVSEETGKRSIPGSMIFAPAGAGLLIANEIIKDIIGEDDGQNN